MSRRLGPDPRGTAPRELLPTPLAQVLAALELEAQPFRAVHRLVDAVEVLVKLHTVVLVSRFAEVITTDQPAFEPTVRKLIAGGLRTPSLGLWWAFARDAGRALAKADLVEPVPGLHSAVASKSPLFQALDGPESLIAFRNRYAHGATPDDATCLADLARVRPRVEALCDGAWPLAYAEIFAVDARGQARLLRGVDPSPIPTPTGAAPGHTYVLRDGVAPLDLHPLVAWLSTTDRGAGAFFYNDLRKSHASALHYAWARHERSELLRRDLLARYPIDAWEGSDAPDDDARVREQIAALTESFKGRRAELGRLIDDLGRRERGFLMVWGAPGIGKSALLARAIEYLSWSEATQRDAYPDLEPPSFLARSTEGAADLGAPPAAEPARATLRLHVVSSLVRRGGFSDVREIFETLNRQLDKRFPMGFGGASTAAEAAALLLERLRKIGPTLRENERLVVVVDGLDEAAEWPEFVRGLPREAPTRVRLIYTSRPQVMVRSEVYEQLEITHRDDLVLAGLSVADTRAVLYDHADKYAIEPSWVDAVVERSGGNPLYLRLLCDALDRREIGINDVARLPKQMSELYDGVLRRVQETPHAASVLALLAAAHAHLADPVLHAMLAQETPGITPEDVRRARAACAEVLVDDPATPEEDWQLFHESLREYLHARDRRGGPVADWQRRLADHGLGWRSLRGPAEAYALRATALHLAETAARDLEDRREAEATAREDQLVALVEDDAWRARSFRVLGNAEALRRAVQLAQVVAVKRHRAAPTEASRKRVARLAQWTWGEAVRLYDEQRKQLRAAHRGDAGTTWRDVAELAAMGPRPRDRVMLAVLALWGEKGFRKTRPELGEAGLARVKAWLEEADETAVGRIWGELGGGGAP